MLYTRFLRASAVFSFLAAGALLPLSASAQFTASCVASPSSPAAGDTVTWNVTVSGGTAPYTYSWSGTDGLSGTSASVSKSYATAGTKSATVQVQSSGAYHSVQTDDGEEEICTNGTVRFQKCSVYSTSPCDATTVGSTYSCTTSGIMCDRRIEAQFGRVKGYECDGPPAVTATCSVSVSAAQPDLTAGAVSPTSAISGSAKTFSATITNTGAGSTGTGFTDLFQKANDSSGGGAVDIGTYSSAAIGSSGSNTASLSYTFPSAGTFYLRACADKASGIGTGTIAESNEGNNCGAWTAVTVTAPITGGSCSASPNPGTVGSPVTWSVSGLSGGTGTYTYSWSGTDSLSGTGASVSKTYSTTGAKTAQVIVSSPPAPAITLTCASETINAAPQPDLTAGAVAPTTATAGAAKTFSATVTNGGTASTGSGFTDLFQKANDSSGTGAASIGTYASAALGTNGSNTASLSYTFPSAGTFYLRVCADQNSSGTGSVSESNEGNNCGAWTAVTVSPAAQPDLTAANAASAPASPVAGTPAALSAIISNAAAPTGAGFTDLFEIDNDTNHATLADIYATVPYSSAALTAGGSNTATGSYTFPSAGTWYIRACADMNTSGAGSIAESNENNNCSAAWTAITVTGAIKPDLTAANVSTSPNPPAAGTPATISGTVFNAAAPTGAGFTDLFEIDNDSNHALISDLYATVPYTSAGLAAGGSNNPSVSYTFPSAGTWYLRLCADMDTSGAGTIDESDETNNCSSGGWITITVGSGSPATLSCSPSPSSGDTSTTYTYKATAGGSWPGAITYTWTDSRAATHGPTNGSTFWATYSAPGSYAAHVHAQSGSTSKDADCSAVNVGAAGACGGAPDSSISASQPRVISGNTDTISWSASNVATSCTVTGPGVNQTIPASSCGIPTGSATPTITTQSTYCIVCDGDSSTKKCVTVDVTPKIIEF